MHDIRYIKQMVYEGTRLVFSRKWSHCVLVVERATWAIVPLLIRMNTAQFDTSSSSYCYSDYAL